MWLVYKFNWWPSKYQISGTPEQIGRVIEDLKKKDIEYYRTSNEPESLKK